MILLEYYSEISQEYFNFQISLRALAERSGQKIFSLRERAQSYLENTSDNIRNQNITVRLISWFYEFKRKVQFTIKSVDVIVKQGFIFFFREGMYC